jgi:hypothetical protein
MFFSTLELISVITLFSATAMATRSHQVWQVTVGNATGGTIFTPNNIVRKVYISYPAII